MFDTDDDDDDAWSCVSNNSDLFISDSSDSDDSSSSNSDVDSDDESAASEQEDMEDDVRASVSAAQRNCVNLSQRPSEDDHLASRSNPSTPQPSQYESFGSPSGPPIVQHSQDEAFGSPATPPTPRTSARASVASSPHISQHMSGQPERDDLEGSVNPAHPSRPLLPGAGFHASQKKLDKEKDIITVPICPTGVGIMPIVVPNYKVKLGTAFQTSGRPCAYQQFSCLTMVIALLAHCLPLFSFGYAQVMIFFPSKLSQETNTFLFSVTLKNKKIIQTVQHLFLPSSIIHVVKL